MTAATAASRSAAPTAQRPRTGGRLRDLGWLTWRQHRLLIILTVVGVLGLMGYLFVLLAKANSMASNKTLLFLNFQEIFNIRTTLALGVPTLAGVATIFWGAPLLAGEFEQRTHLVVWSQDVSPVRWLVTKIALLGGILIVLAAGLEVVVRRLLDAVAALSLGGLGQFNPLGIVAFESSIPLQMSYALFGFALGIAFGAVLRRTVAAMGASLVVFVLVRWSLAVFGRKHYEIPVHYVGPVTQQGPDIPMAALLDEGNLGPGGALGAYPPACYVTRSQPLSSTQFAACAKSHGLGSSYLDYQPLSRVPTFQLIEFGIYLVLTAGCLFVAYRSVRRSQRV
jgi:hypothetical protein